MVGKFEDKKKCDVRQVFVNKKYRYMHEILFHWIYSRPLHSSDNLTVNTYNLF